MKTYEIEKINLDNYRPGMPKSGYLVRYNAHESYGWLCRRCFPSLPEAETFAMNLAAGEQNEREGKSHG